MSSKPLFTCAFCSRNITNEDGYLVSDAAINSDFGFLCYYCNAGLQNPNFDWRMESKKWQAMKLTKPHGTT